jgi:hypothetical protein
MTNKTTMKRVEHWIKAARFYTTDGRPLEVKRVYEHPQTGEPVVELQDVEEQLRTAQIVSMEPASGSSRIARNWTLDEVREILRFLFGNRATPKLVKEYLSTRDEAHFAGKWQQEIDAEFINFLRSKRPDKRIRDVTEENTGKAFQIIGAEMPKDESAKDPGDSRIAGSRSDPNNRFNFDA